MMVASNEVEDAIIRLAQMARAAYSYDFSDTTAKCGCHYRNHQSKCPFSNGFCSLVGQTRVPLLIPTGGETIRSRRYALLTNGRK